MARAGGAAQPCRHRAEGCHRREVRAGRVRERGEALHRWVVGAALHVGEAGRRVGEAGEGGGGHIVAGQPRPGPVLAMRGDAGGDQPGMARERGVTAKRAAVRVVGEQQPRLAEQRVERAAGLHRSLARIEKPDPVGAVRLREQGIRGPVRARRAHHLGAGIGEQPPAQAQRQPVARLEDEHPGQRVPEPGIRWGR